jgi:hypothetical protein
MLAQFWTDVVMALGNGASLLGRLPSGFWPALCGATVGTVISNVIARRTQRWVTEEARKDRRDVKRQEDLAAAMLMAANIMQIAGYFGVIQARFDRELSRDGPTEPWQRVRPFANAPSRITFTERETTFVVSLKDGELFLAVVKLALRYSDFMQIPLLYTRLWEEVAVLSTSDASRGQRVTFLNSLIEDMVREARFNYAYTCQVFEYFTTRCRQVFGDEIPSWKFGDHWIGAATGT